MSCEQISIFDYSNTKESIKRNLKEYEIDNFYKSKFKDGTYTFFEIYKTLSKKSNFIDYLEALSKELKKYIKESDDCGMDFYNNALESSFTTREDCIMIYNSFDRSVGPLYCAEMLKETLFKRE